MPKVIVYTKDFCPYCVQAKLFLTRKGVTFEEINLTDSPEEYEALRDETNFYTLPQIFVEDDFIGGYENLINLNKRGKLDQILQLESVQ